MMKDEYDFSKGERGKFVRGEMPLAPPVHLEPEMDLRVERARKILRVLAAEGLQICLGIAFIEASDRHRFMSNLPNEVTAITELTRDGVLLRLAMATARVTDHPMPDRDTIGGLCSLLKDPGVVAMVALNGNHQRLEQGLRRWRHLRDDKGLTPLRTSRNCRFAHSVSSNWSASASGPYLTHELTISLAKDTLRVIDDLLIGCNGASGLDNHSRFCSESADSYFSVFRTFGAKPLV